MPARKPQPNYLPFFGPYKRDEKASHNTPSRLLLSPPKKSQALASFLQAGLMSPVPGVNEDLSGAFPESKEVLQQFPDNSQPAKQRSPSMAGRIWDWANKGLISGDTIIGATSGVTREEIERAMEEVDPDHPYRQAARTFALGAYKDLADLASDFTSPISIALAGLGGVAKSASAAKKLAQTGQRLNRAQRVAVGTAPAAKSILAGAGAGFAGKGAYGLATGRPLDTLVSTAKILTGGQPDVSPKEAGQDYANAAAFFSGLGGAVSPFDFARVPLRNLPDELPARQHISYSDHDNSLITMEEAFRRSGAPSFREKPIKPAEQILKNFGGRFVSSEPSVSPWGIGPEPSATAKVWIKPRSGDAGGAGIGKTFGQQAVLRFQRAVRGADAEYRLVGLEDPVAALDVFEKHGISGARVEGRDIVFVGEKRESGPKVRAAAKELGAPVRQISGRARIIEAKDYDSILAAHEQPTNLEAPALEPSMVAAGAASYATNDRRKPRSTRRPSPR